MHILNFTASFSKVINKNFLIIVVLAPHRVIFLIKCFKIMYR